MYFFIFDSDRASEVAGVRASECDGDAGAEVTFRGVDAAQAAHLTWGPWGRRRPCVVRLLRPHIATATSALPP